MKFASAERQNGVFKVPSEVGWWKVRIWEVTTVEVRVFILSSCTVTVVQNVTYWTRIPVVWSQVQLFRYFNNRRGCIWNNWVICKITELKGLEDDLTFFFYLLVEKHPDCNEGAPPEADLKWWNLFIIYLHRTCSSSRSSRLWKCNNCSGWINLPWCRYMREE